jgi:hypothetical protein
MTYAVGTLIVLAVLILAFMVVRAVGGRVRGRRGSRLGISEYREIDKSRRLVLVRRDGIEHLLLIGGGQDLVVESGIAMDEVPAERPVRRRPPAIAEEAREEPREPVLRPVEAPPSPPRRAPRPAVFGDRLPEPRPAPRDIPKLQVTPRDRDGNA